MKVQISYSGINEGDFVEILANRLWEIDIEAHRDNLKSPRAERSPDWLDQELRKYDFIIPVLSAGYLQDKWLQTELLQGMVRERADKVTFVVPVLVSDCTVPVLLQDRLVDFMNVPFEEAFFRLATSLTESHKDKVFVIMKFHDDRLDSMYSLVIKPIADDFGFSVLRIDEVQDSGLITEQILKDIEQSVIVIADLTGERPNCYYEIGYAHALGKELILTIHKDSKIHFDLAGHRFIQWETEKELMDSLRLRFAAIVEKRRKLSA